MICSLFGYIIFIMKKAFKRKLEELGVAIVYLFGSSTTRNRRKDSDIDLGIVFKVGLHRKNSLEIYPELYNIFSELYPTKEIDIVFLEDAPLSLQFEAIKYGKVIFESDTNTRLNYEEKIMLLYADFLPLQEEIEKVILERI